MDSYRECQNVYIENEREAYKFWQPNLYCIFLKFAHTHTKGFTQSVLQIQYTEFALTTGCCAQGGATVFIQKRPMALLPKSLACWEAVLLSSSPYICAIAFAEQSANKLRYSKLIKLSTLCKHFVDILIKYYTGAQAFRDCSKYLRLLPPPYRVCIASQDFISISVLSSWDVPPKNMCPFLITFPLLWVPALTSFTSIPSQHALSWF